jgi:hypothetical protein
MMQKKFIFLALVCIHVNICFAIPDTSYVGSRYHPVFATLKREYPSRNLFCLNSDTAWTKTNFGGFIPQLSTVSQKLLIKEFHNISFGKLPAYIARFPIRIPLRFRKIDNESRMSIDVLDSAKLAQRMRLLTTKKYTRFTAYQNRATPVAFYFEECLRAGEEVYYAIYLKNNPYVKDGRVIYLRTRGKEHANAELLEREAFIKAIER